MAFSSRGIFTVNRSRAGFGSMRAWSSTIASTETVLRIVCFLRPSAWSSATMSAIVCASSVSAAVAPSLGRMRPSATS